MTDGRPVWAMNFKTQSNEYPYDYSRHSALQLSSTQKYLGMRHRAYLTTDSLPIEAITVFNATNGAFVVSIYS